MLRWTKKAISEIPDSEKIQLISIFLAICFAVVLILMAISFSRGKDIDYFKDKMYFLEHRFEKAEKIRDDMKNKISDLEKQNLETNAKLVEISNRVSDNERWIEEYNKLPTLPKPKALKHNQPRP